MGAKNSPTILRDAGLVMTEERQIAFAEAIMKTLQLKETPSHAEVESSLANLKIPLSEEILAMQ